MQMNANHGAMICRCGWICQKESHSFRIPVLVGSVIPGTPGCLLEILCGNAREPTPLGGSSTSGNQLGGCNHPPGQPGRCRAGNGRGLPWARAASIAKVGIPGICGRSAGGAQRAGPGRKD